MAHPMLRRWRGLNNAAAMRARKIAGLLRRRGMKKPQSREVAMLVEGLKMPEWLAENLVKGELMKIRPELENKLGRKPKPEEEGQALAEKINRMQELIQETKPNMKGVLAELSKRGLDSVLEEMEMHANPAEAAA